MMNLAKILTGAVAFGFISGGTAFGASYFIEGEDFVAYQTENSTPVLLTEGTGPYAGEEMSGGAYLEIPFNTYLTFQLPANAVPAGTYYLALRSSSAAGEGLIIDRANGLVTPYDTFSTIGMTYNPESGNVGEFGWDWVENYFNSNEFLSITIVEDQAITFRMNPSTTDKTIYLDVIGLLDDNTSLPNYVPEPASLGLFVIAAGALMVRRFN